MFNKNVIELDKNQDEFLSQVETPIDMSHKISPFVKM